MPILLWLNKNQIYTSDSEQTKSIKLLNKIKREKTTQWLGVASYSRASYSLFSNLNYFPTKRKKLYEVVVAVVCSIEEIKIAIIHCLIRTENDSNAQYGMM